MRSLVFGLLALVVSTNCDIATAADLDVSLSVGMGKSVLNHIAFERVGILGIRYGNTWKVQANGGYWLALAQGEKASMFTSLQGGLEVVGESGVFASVMFGPAWVQNPDVKLSGHFQFHPVFGFGVKNSKGYSLAFAWQHFSNAGIILPNMGRDLLTGQVTIPISHK